MLISKYNNIKSQKPENIEFESYVGQIQYGANQSDVETARGLKKQGNEKEYKRIKSDTQVVFPSVQFNPGSKSADNIDSYSGIICMDIDEKVNKQTLEKIKLDPFTFCVHKSFGGDGICIFYKINPDKFLNGWHNLSEYIMKEYQLPVDPSCKNTNRARYISFDSDIYYNPKSNTWKKYKVEVKEKPKSVNYVFIEDDFTRVLNEIVQRGIDLTKTYHDWLMMGFAIADKFGDNGLQYFKAISQNNPNFKHQDCEKQYNRCLKSKRSGITIATFYYYAKLEGVEIYSDRSKKIINQASIHKKQGGNNAKDVAENVKTTTGKECNDDEVNAIKEILESNNEYSQTANQDTPQLTQIKDFIIEVYRPYKDTLADVVFINDKPLDDTILNDIYYNCETHFDFTVKEKDVIAILNSSQIRQIEPITDFFDTYKDENVKGYIEKYANLVTLKCEHESRTIKAIKVELFTKWIVGAVHNWLAPFNEEKACPLTLVLSSKKQGSGKTSFFRHMLPKELRPYVTQSKTDSNDKDNMFLLCTNLLVYDDEFGGQALKDVKAYKMLSDQNIIKQRRPYAKAIKSYKRRAILGGTTNEVEILRDVTGNRRIIPFDVKEIDYDNLIKFDTNKLWVEAYNLYKSGYKWELYSEHDVNKLSELDRKFQEHKMSEGLFEIHFNKEMTKEFYIEKLMNIGEIISYFKKHFNVNVYPNEVKDSMTKLGVELKEHYDNSKGRGRKCYKFYSVLATEEDELNEFEKKNKDDVPF